MWQEFKDNLKEVWKTFSAWVAGAGALLLLAWQMFPPQLLTDLFEAFPILKAVAPIAWFIAFVVARAAPQANVNMK
jgi:hypothetical protein